MNNKTLLAAGLGILLVGILLGKSLVDVKGPFLKGRVNGCQTLANSLPFEGVSCELDKAGMLYVTGPVVKGGRFNLDQKE